MLTILQLKISVPKNTLKKSSYILDMLINVIIREHFRRSTQKSTASKKLSTGRRLLK